ncbi:hypothetical protein ACFZCP_28735 [Streptomyces sp. NPDC007971]|uniref:hypothetical protein n=1 Tax=unclassified Streptomyces TaxID=2593676 RepID=UPI00343C8C70
MSKSSAITPFGRNAAVYADQPTISDQEHTLTSRLRSNFMFGFNRLPVRAIGRSQ